MAEVVVHRATPRDAGIMAVLHASSFAKPWEEAAMAQFIAGPDTVCLIASAVGPSAVPSGMLIARRAADEAELLTLAVAPHCRRHSASTTRSGQSRSGDAPATTRPGRMPRSSALPFPHLPPMMAPLSERLSPRSWQRPRREKAGLSGCAPTEECA
jgi:hypothetical protein